MSRLSPLLFLDIDGVISLFGFEPSARPPGRFTAVDGIPHFLSEDAAIQIRSLAGEFELVWCSGWEEKADEHLPFVLGLPAGLPHLRFDEGGAAGSGHWKLPAIERYAGPTRPLAWVDDAHDEACRTWAQTREGPTLLLATEPATGLTAEHTARLRAWAGEVRD